MPGKSVFEPVARYRVKPPAGTNCCQLSVAVLTRLAHRKFVSVALIRNCAHPFVAHTAIRQKTGNLVRYRG